MTEQEIKINAVAIAEGWYDKEPTEDEWLKAFQHLIDTGMCWQLQGWFGRTAMGLIEGGLCTPPKKEGNNEE